MSRYRLTRLAESDLADIWSYIGLEQENPTAADTVLSTLRARFTLLATQLLMGVSREEYGESLRSFTSDNYLIFYRPIDDGIEVVRVVRGGREISTRYFEVEMLSHRRSAMRLTGKVALVTGSQQGIGQAIALAYGREGASVIVNYLDNQAAAEQIASQIRESGPSAVTVSGNVAREGDVQAMIEAGTQWGGIDILVNNAGIFPRVDFLDMTEAQWEEVLGVNLKGSFLCTQAVARQLVARGQGGAVINLASGAAFRSSPRGVHYVSSKAGIVGLTRAAALELAQYRIRVNAIAPGLTDTAQPRYGMSEEEMQDRGREVPLGRMATPDDIADMAVFLASEEARYVTGQTMHVNGGQYLG